MFVEQIKAITQTINLNFIATIIFSVFFFLFFFFDGINQGNIVKREFFVGHKFSFKQLLKWKNNIVYCKMQEKNYAADALFWWGEGWDLLCGNF